MCAQTRSTDPASDDERYAVEFPLDPGVVYLNHAAVCPLPRRSAEAVRRFAQDCERHGALHYERWLATESRLRAQLARLVNASSADDIALLKNTSEGLSTVAFGFPWRDGDNVVISDEEFPSNRVVWESLRDKGVSVREVSLHADEDAEGALVAAADGRTRMIAISAIQFASGFRLDLEKLGSLCRARGIALCVDAIQSLGAVRIDVQASHVDFLAADAHKWLLGPEGIAVFYCAAPWRERLVLHQYGWHMREVAGDYEGRSWRPAASARRFECGSPNMLGIHALSASLQLLEEVGMETVEQRVLSRAEHLFERLRARPDLSPITSDKTGRYGGIVTFNSSTFSPQEAVARLREKGIVAAARGGGIRLSPHYYTTLAQLDQALAAIPA